ncbi:hypothetical protein E2C01_046799 [Portunus trituberculatus]|uniref:Uncharacterized protein n=1 Tax=Portunus trituberculatus TaxID=210409 RepID=A0A5B7G753_PORTR|nr:hypothetical protein [Portunus trituberculatus]
MNLGKKIFGSTCKTYLVYFYPPKRAVRLILGTDSTTYQEALTPCTSPPYRLATNTSSSSSPPSSSTTRATGSYSLRQIPFLDTVSGTTTSSFPSVHEQTDIETVQFPH